MTIIRTRAPLAARAANAALVVLAALACGVDDIGEGKADSFAVAQMTATPGTPVTLPHRESVAALRGMRVMDVRAAFQDFSGVDTAALRAHVEARVRESGVAVDSSAAPMLLVNCFALPGRTGTFAYTCAADVADDVRYEHPTPARYQAILWGSAPVVGMAGGEYLTQGVTDIVDDVVREFVEAWRKANAP